MSWWEYVIRALQQIEHNTWQTEIDTKLIQIKQIAAGLTTLANDVAAEIAVRTFRTYFTCCLFYLFHRRKTITTFQTLSLSTLSSVPAFISCKCWKRKKKIKMFAQSKLPYAVRSDTWLLHFLTGTILSELSNDVILSAEVAKFQANTVSNTTCLSVSVIFIANL